MAQAQNQLKGKGVILTGAAQGIGKSMALGFSERGARLCLIDINEKGLQATAEEVTQRGGEVHTVTADLSKVNEIRRAASRTLEALEETDILVNNAGITALAPAESLSEAQWDAVMDLNLKGLFFLCQEVGRHMIPRRQGAIVNVSSLSAFRALDDHVAYCASKSGVVAVTKVLALEWGKYNIRVNGVAPTIVMTPMGRRAWAGKKGEDYKKRIPLNRFADPEDVVAAAAYLASDESRMVSGVTIKVDGGFATH
jgi:NAD(P)-dependent dehydrogenase (short-subunit alcohol dehydrogenase family)